MNFERRQKPRINDPVAIVVRGSKDHGKSYQFDTITQDIGAGGLRALAPRIMEAGEKILLHIRFALAGSRPLQAPVIAARAVVMRVEERPDGSCNFAASFLRHRII